MSSWPAATDEALPVMIAIVMSVDSIFDPRMILSLGPEFIIVHGNGIQAEF